jgi:hypothetical protein
LSFFYLDPRQGPAGGLVEPAPRLATLTGARIGALWNNRPGGDVVLRETIRILDRRHEFADVCFVKKPYLGNEAPEAVLQELEARVDAALVGIGD